MMFFTPNDKYDHFNIPDPSLVAKDKIGYDRQTKHPMFPAITIIDNRQPYPDRQVIEVLLTQRGWQTFAPFAFEAEEYVSVPSEEIGEIYKTFSEMQRWRIEKSDAVYVYNPDWIVDDTMMWEIVYAKLLNKKIFCMHPISYGVLTDDDDRPGDRMVEPEGMTYDTTPLNWNHGTGSDGYLYARAVDRGYFFVLEYLGDNKYEGMFGINYGKGDEVWNRYTIAASTWEGAKDRLLKEILHSYDDRAATANDVKRTIEAKGVTSYRDILVDGDEVKPEEKS